MDLPMENTETSVFEANTVHLMPVITGTILMKKLSWWVSFLIHQILRIKLEMNALQAPVHYTLGRSFTIISLPANIQHPTELWILELEWPKLIWLLVDNLGTVAKFRINIFTENLQAGTENSLIGHFGFVFYIAYFATEKVTVITNHDDRHKETMGHGT